LDDKEVFLNALLDQLSSRRVCSGSASIIPSIDYEKSPVAAEQRPGFLIRDVTSGNGNRG
jgi:hypothetical protein